jgi:hypothetical protein
VLGGVGGFEQLLPRLLVGDLEGDLAKGADHDLDSVHVLDGTSPRGRSVILPALYHWAPRDRRESIRSEGLKPYSPPTVCTGEHVSPYLSLSPDPARAWHLSGAMDWHECEEWDLWQVRLAEHDDVHIRPDFGPEIQEVKLYNPIPADRLWFVGERGSPCFEAAA